MVFVPGNHGEQSRSGAGNDKVRPGAELSYDDLDGAPTTGMAVPAGRMKPGQRRARQIAFCSARSVGPKWDTIEKTGACARKRGLVEDPLTAWSVR